MIVYVARLVADGKMPAAGGTFTAGSLGTFAVSDSPAPGTIIYLQYNF